MKRVTKNDVDTALLLWKEASERAQAEHLAWGALLQGQQTLIRSMIDNGWTYAQAKRDVDNASTVHNEALLTALTEMDERCRQYLELEAALKAQQQQP